MNEAALASNNSAGLASQFNPSSASSAQPGQSASDLFSQYGSDNVQQSVNNSAVSALGNTLNDMINQLPMPDFMRDAARQQVSSTLDSFQSPTPEGLDQGVGDVLSSAGAESDVNNIMNKAMQDEMEGASGGNSKANGGGAGGGNWLAVLARALGSTSGEHLKKMVQLGEEMGELDSKENPEQFAQFQSEFQAESQIFKMFQEAIGTMVKSIGDGMATVARKQ